MTTDLQERLRTLAERAPAPRPGADLWRAGRRRQVRRTVAGAAVTLLAAVVAGVGMSALWTRLPEPAPVEGTPELVLPDRFFTPSAWLPGTDDKGPLGPLVAVIGANRTGWFGGDRAGLVGISVDGTYRFLDLPDASPYPEQGAQALSADGRWFAYWYVGRPSGEAKMQGGDVLPAVGVAVYDTVTGQVTRRPVVSEHGLITGGPSWSGDVVWFDYTPYDEGGSWFAGGGGSWEAEIRWNVGSGDVVTIRDFRESVSTSSAGPAPGGMVAAASANRRGVAVTRGASVTSYVKPDLHVTTRAVSPDGRRLAGTFDPTPSRFDGSPRPIVVGEMPDESTIGTTRLAMRRIGATAQRVLGWRDDTHVVVLRSQGRTAGVYSLDITTGDGTLLSRIDAGGWSSEASFASGVWAAPVVTADEPDWPMDPRLRAVLWTLAIGALLVGVRILRRRRAGP